jgi:hypothetical protein
MMRYRKLDANGDYTFGNGQLDFYRDEPAAVGQSVLTRLLLWLGEWYLNIDSGTPYMQGILGKYSKDVADTTIQERVLATDNVTDILNYESSIEPNKRDMSVSFDLDTAFGPTTVEVTNYANY